MTICCLGDLVLDVIVRLEQPLATGADATSRIVLRPGGQAANVAAWVAALGGSSRFVGKRGADDAGALAASRLRELGVELARPGRAGRQRRHRLARRPDGRADDVPRPRRRGRAPPRGDRRGVVRGLRPPPRLGLRAPARARPLRRGPRRSSSRARRGARVSIDLSSWSAIRDFGARALPRPSRGARARRRLRERGRGQRSSAARSPGAPGSSSAAPPAPRSTATSGPPCRSRRRRLDRSGRRLRRRLARRRAGSRARGRRTLRAARRVDAGQRRR